MNTAVPDDAMLLTSIYKSVLTRILAAAIIVLVVSPYSEPFATMAGTDFGGAGAVDCGGGSKFKSPSQDAVAPAPLRLVLVEMCLPSESPMAMPMALATRSHQRLVLRLSPPPSISLRKSTPGGRRAVVVVGVYRLPAHIVHMTTRVSAEKFACSHDVERDQ